MQTTLRPAFFALCLAPLVATAGPTVATVGTSVATVGAPVATVGTPRAPAAHVLVRDERTGVPTLLRSLDSSSAPAALQPTAEAAARYWLSQHARRYGLSPAALETERLVRQQHLGAGATLVVLRQVVQGVELLRHDVKVLLDARGALLAISGAPHPAATATLLPGRFRLTAGTAVATALEDAYHLGLTEADLQQTSLGEHGWRRFELNSAGHGVRLTGPTRARPVWFAEGDELQPAFEVEVLARRDGAPEEDATQVLISAQDGAVLSRKDLTHHATFSYRVYAESTGDHRPFDGPLADLTPHPTGVPDHSVPAQVSATLVSLDGFNATHDPWLDAAATSLSGNNVEAFTDDLNPEGFSAGDVRAAPSASGTFDYLYDDTVSPQANLTQQSAALTNLFYVTNWLHDWWYDSGFDEAAGSAQQVNYGRGGIEGDPLWAEAQAGAPTERNNSSIAVMGDGSSPRMHINVWNGPVAASLDAAGATWAVHEADFGPTNFTTTAPLVLADDGVGTLSDACQPLPGTVAGKVVLIHRGACSYKNKVLSAQSAGAVAVLIADNQVAALPPLLLDDPSLTPPVTIGAFGVTQATGAALEAALAAGPVTATLTRTTGADLDGDLDNTLVAHEWGHYLHLRQVDCASPQCGAQSEGWGDFTALMMLLRQGDALDGTYAMVQYAGRAVSDDSAYFGLRRYPYSVDLTKNPLTFKHVSDAVSLPTTAPLAPQLSAVPNSESHNAGEVWAQMLFEGLVALIKQSQLPSPRYSFEEARRRMGNYVVGGLQLAPVDPTWLEQRDALLIVAGAADPQDAELLAAAFARRGAGTCAVGPPRNSTDFTPVTEDFTVGPFPQLVSATVDDSVASCDQDGVLDAAETGTLTLVIANAGLSVWQGTVTVSSTNPAVSFPGGAVATFGALGPGQQGSVGLEVSLAPDATGLQQLSFQLQPNPAAACSPVAPFEVIVQANQDVLAAATATDDVESTPTTWTIGGSSGSAAWAIEEVRPGEHAWLGPDAPYASDSWVESPSLQVADGAPLVLTFSARYSLEASANVNWDGVVLEVSPDDGATWADVSTWAAVPAGFGPISAPAAATTNPLHGRVGFVGRNPAYPAADTFAFELGTALGGKTARVRFRVGTDIAAGDLGFELDQVAFTGLANTPFGLRVEDSSTCPLPAASVEGGPRAKGCGCSQPSAAVGLWLVALVVAAARRRLRPSV